MFENKFRSFLNRYYSNSGTVPSVDELDQMIQGELNLENQRRLQDMQFSENKRQFDLSIQNRERDRVSQSATGLGSTVAQLGTSYLLGDKRYMYSALGGRYV